MPEKRTTIPLNRRFSSEEIKRIRKGLIPQQQEDKWFIYWDNDRLFFHRSWTGFCVYIVQFESTGDIWRMVGAEVNRDPTQYSETSDEIDTELVSYLIDVLLLHRAAEFPTNEFSADKRAIMNWSQVGRAMLGEHPDDDSN